MREKILELLKSTGRELRDHGSSVMMICPNPEHAGGRESTPSFKVNLEPPFAGSSFCFGCQIHGSWKKVTAPLLGFSGSGLVLHDQVSDTFSDIEADRMLGRAVAKAQGFRERWPRTQSWRAVPGSLVVDVGGSMVLNGDGREPVLRLPVMVRGKEATYIDCKIRPAKDDKRKYLNEGGAAAKSALFPYDYVRSRYPDLLAIVEGPRDALVTIRNGLLALATLGSYSWNKRCVNLVLAVAPKTLLIMTDPDEAGDRLKRMIHRDLSPLMKIVVVNLPSKLVTKPNGAKVKKKLVDPADLSARQLRRMLEKVGINLGEK